MKKNICEEISKWQKEYDKKPLVDLSQYFTTKDKEIIKKLNIVLNDKVYTEYEFECLEMDLIAFYKQKEILKNIGITYNEIKRIWNICDTIREDYCI